MKNKNLAFLIVVGIAVLFLVVIGFKKGDTLAAADADPAAVFKAKCAVCHTAKAEKFFDPTKPDEQLSAVILNGKKDARPPMPEYATKGITPDGAKALVAYMRKLRAPADANANVNANADSNVNAANANANTNANTNANGVNVNAKPNVNATVNAANANSKANANRVGNTNR